MLSHNLGHGVQRVEGVFVGQSRVIWEDLLPDMTSERLQHSEVDTSGGGVDGTAVGRSSVDEVEHAITAFYRVVLAVQAVHAHEVQERLTFDFFRSVSKVAGGDTVLVAQIHDVHLEIGGCHLIGSHVVDVLHHQVPHRSLGVDGGALQHLGDQKLWLANGLVGEFTDLEHSVLTYDSILVCHRKGLVGVERNIQGDET